MNLTTHFRPAFERDRRCRGFSLLELLVAVSLLVVLMVGLLAMFGQTQRAMRTGITQVDVMEGGRVAMELMSREVQELAPTKVGFVTNFFASAVAASTPLVLELPGSKARTNELDQFFFLSRTNLDDWVGIGYRVDDPGEGVGTLYRFTTNYSNRGLSSGTLPQPARVFDQLRIRRADGAIDPRFRRVLDGVVHLRVLVYDARGEVYNPFLLALTNSPNSVREVLINPNYTRFAFLNGRVPAYVEIELGVLEPAVYQQYRAQPTELRQRFLEGKAGHVHVFRQRIPIRTGS